MAEEEDKKEESEEEKPEGETEEGAEGTEEPAEKPKKDFLGIIVFLLVTINLIALGGMGYFLQQMWGKIRNVQVAVDEVAQMAIAEHEPEPKHEETDEMGKELEPTALGVLYPLDGFLVNLSSPMGPKFLQTQIELELAEPAVEEEVVRVKPAIRDAIIVLLSGKAYSELRDPAGMRKLRDDLKLAINNILTTGRIKTVYFTQFHFN